MQSSVISIGLLLAFMVVQVQSQYFPQKTYYGLPIAPSRGQTQAFTEPAIANNADPLLIHNRSPGVPGCFSLLFPIFSVRSTTKQTTTLEDVAEADESEVEAVEEVADKPEEEVAEE
ncbi:uncharacterized protein LOC126748252 [Anthonomus grandis grandis]|uniref:uncharacterized protein LOC126748252 n=1 Tax=Anthonomus grandis grandis TaxID=2921223 RepID=UPI0021656FCC|nr:uncharacterized protein LOC126748252 [Anthonomus grandis grandis]